MPNALISRMAGTFTLGALLALAGCDSGTDTPAGQPPSLEQVARTAAATSWSASQLPAPEAFPQPEDKLANLGMILFFSKTLGGDFDVACASCHMPDLGGGDGLSLSVGVDAVTPAFLGPGRKLDTTRDRDPQADGGPNVPRNAQTIFNVGLYNRAMFHDGRVFVLDDVTEPGGTGQAIRTTDSEMAVEDMTLPTDFGLLEAQALFPVTSTNEMRGRHRFSNLLTNQDVRDKIVARMLGAVDTDHMARNDWAALFRDTFNRPVDEAPEAFITFHNIARAIAAYERSQYFVDTPWRDFMTGDDNAISAAAKRGANLFYSPASAGGVGCAACHEGAHFTDEDFHTVGFPQIGRGKRVDKRDMGRYAVVQNPAELHAYRTPSLLNVALTAPYGHAGTFDTLDEVVAYHLDALPALSAFDFSLDQLAQFRDDPVTYPLASDRSHEVAYVDPERVTSRLSPLLVPASLSAAQRADLVAFLHTLTDRCAEDVACLSRWVPTSDMDPDGNQLVRTSNPDAGRPADPGDVFMGPPGTVIDGGGTGGGTGGTNGSTGVIPPPVPEFLAGRTFCLDRVGQTATGSGFAERTAAAGITHEHHFSLATWLITTLEDALQSGGVAAGDFDGDCDVDLVFTGGEGQGTLVYSNDSAGGFALSHNLDSVTGSNLTGPAIADLDGDYRPEILLGNMRPGLLPVLSGSIDGGFAIQHAVYMANNTFGIAIGDADGDGRLDVFAGHWDSRRATEASPALLRNDIDNGLVSADRVAGTSSSTSPLRFQFSPAFVDIDRNGSQDLLIAADFLNSLVLRNDGSGHYTSITDRNVIKDQNGMGAAVADFDGDGHLDWFVSAIKGPTDARVWSYGILGNRLYKGHGDGTFEDVTAVAGVEDAGWAWGSCAGDFNNDGHPDLFVVGGYGLFPDLVLAALPASIATMITTTFDGYYTMQPRLWINDGSGHFDNQATAWGLTESLNGRGVSCVDLDRDGDVDLLVSQNEGAPRYYENRNAPAAHNFLGISLRGPAPNTAGIGAMVDIATGAGTQVMPVAANSNFISQNTSDLHVGIGTQTEATVTVHWPGGAVTVTGPVPANRFITIDHPSMNPTKLGIGTIALQAAVDRTIAWLTTNPPSDPQAMRDLAMIGQRFGLGLGSTMQAGYDAMVDDLYALLDIPAAENAELYRRVFDDQQAVNSGFFTATGEDALLLTALYCRDLAVPADYAQSLRTAAGVPSEATTALRSLLWVRDNNCAAAILPADVAAIQQAVLPLSAVAGDVVSADQLEAMALLAAAGRREGIPVAAINGVLARELPGGGWTATGAEAPLTGSETADARATVMALWLLLELDEGESRFNRLVVR